LLLDKADAQTRHDIAALRRNEEIPTKRTIKRIHAENLRELQGLTGDPNLLHQLSISDNIHPAKQRK